MPQERIPDGVYAVAAELLERGEPYASVERRLVVAGVNVETARRIINDQRRAAAAVEKNDTSVDMRFGAVVLGGGILVLAVGGGNSLVGWFGLAVGMFSLLNGLRKQRRLRTATD